MLLIIKEVVSTFLLALFFIELIFAIREKNLENLKTLEFNFRLVNKLLLQSLIVVTIIIHILIGSLIWIVVWSILFIGNLFLLIQFLSKFKENKNQKK